MDSNPLDSPVELRALEYVSSYEPHLMCPICHCPFIRPIRLQCDHFFCQKCLNEYISSNHSQTRFSPMTDVLSCPTCRAPTMTSSSRVPRLLINMCDDVRVKCPLSKEGCLEITQRGHIQTHVDKYCDYRLVRCPDRSCAKLTRKKDLDPDGECLHEIRQCEDCEEPVMKQDFKKHTTALCASLITICQDCNESLHCSELAGHVDSCPDAIKPCRAAKYGCKVSLRNSELAQHEDTCPLAALGPYLEEGASRIESMESTIRQLQQRNEVLEDGIANIRATLANINFSQPATPQTISAPFLRSPSPPTLLQPTMPLSMPPTIDLNPLPVPGETTPASTRSSTTNYLLSIHESLREEVSQLSSSITDLDARASMSIMNESLRLREDMAHINAGLTSIRMQVHWLMNPRLQQAQRTTTTTASAPTSAGGSTGAASNEGARAAFGIGNSFAGRSSSASNSPPPQSGGSQRGRRLSDTMREGTKL
ncbi:hypothetical protein AJ80_06986 [Polytolypa hystricis UAMH7299]|uniref:RING-type domain-containing protein n=1 Tax=Polytolypa hystricis (strain UAMH7299) TaxID=1447883 RepID=A0A2B7XRZ6_POLH7|nr:hypothetical protein AJ80_06986 [Polytolypa hystricis UAMH7299]